MSLSQMIVSGYLSRCLSRGSKWPWASRTLRAFSPDLLLLSSGFDGACGDIGNSKTDDKEKYHQGLDLSAADFAWATEQLLGVAAICCPGRVVSVLEGGYGSFEPTKETESGWMVSRAQLAENVGAHLSALAGVQCMGQQTLPVARGRA